MVVEEFFNPPSLVLKAWEPTNALVMLAESLVMLSYTVFTFDTGVTYNMCV